MFMGTNGALKKEKRLFLSSVGNAQKHRNEDRILCNFVEKVVGR